MFYFIGNTRPELNFAVRTRLFLNNDVVMSVGSVAEELGVSKALVVTGPVMGRADSVGKIKDGLQSAEIEFVIWDKVEPDPPEASVEACARHYSQNECDGLVAFGGGSSMDTAKMAGCLVSGGGAIREYDSMGQERQVPEKTPPLVCIPTTSGTGSEVTSMALFTRADDGSKRVVTSPGLCPDVALVDPLLSYSMPPSLTAATGMDAFNHAIEAYLSTMSNPISDALALYAMELIFEFLPRAVKNGQDEEARTNMSVAAVMAGIAMNHAMPHFAHAIGHALGSKFKLPHGVACSLVLVAGLRKLKEAQLDKFERIARIFGLHPERYPDGKATAGAAVEAIEEMMKKIGIPTIAEAIGQHNGELLAVAAASMMEPAMMFSPVFLSEEDVMEILGLKTR